MSATLLHIQVIDDSTALTDDDLQQIADVFNDGLEDWGIEDEYEAFVTGGEVSIHDVPALDEYADDVAERVADKLDG